MKSTIRAINVACCLGPFIAASGLFSAAVRAQAVATPYTTGHWYDIGGRLTGTVRACTPVGSSSSCLGMRYDYNSAGLVSEEDDGSLGAWPTSQPSQWTFSSTSRILTYGYDSMGRLAWERVYSGVGTPYKLTEYAYDSVGREVCVAIRMNPSAGPTGNACALSTQGAYGSDRITFTTYDQQNHRVDIYRAYGTAIPQHYAHYNYTPNGLESAVTDANGNPTTLYYDGLDRVLEMEFPSKTTTSPGTSDSGDTELCTSYDNDNNCKTRVTRDGQTIQYQYDHLNRLTYKLWPSPDTKSFYYTYNLQNERLSATFGSASGAGVYDGYDGFGEVTSETETMGSTAQVMSYQYDADGDRNRVTYPDNTYIQYTYDGLDRLQNVLLGGTTSLAAYSYDAMGRLQQVSRGAGVAWTTYGYDGISRLSSLEHIFSSPADDVTYSFGYNPDDQITSDTISNDEYDILTTGSDSYVANGLNEYSTVGGHSLSYDGRGNLKADASTTYSYDIENHLTGGGPSSAALIYDPLGRLYEVSSTSGITTFLYDGNRIIAEYNGSGTLTNRYAYGIEGDDPIVWYQGSSVATPQYLFADHSGSIVAMTSSAGDVFATDQYGSYGEVGTSNQNQGRFRFTGQAYIPELSLYYYKARLYDPTLGRFMQTDPIGYTDDIDLYAYVGDDPVDGTDPSGTKCIWGLNSWDDFCQRSYRYAKLAAEPAISSHTNFFGAAAVVTAALGGWPQGKFMHDLSATLEKANIAAAEKIRSGQLYSGGTIEQNTKKFVHFEQTNVQAALDKLRTTDPKQYVSVVATANKDLNSSFSFVARVTDSTFARADADARKALHRDIDFANQSDRELLGIDVAKEVGGGGYSCVVATGENEICSK